MDGHRVARGLLVPGLFLFVLGVGNISVGLYKVWQYEEVLSELAELRPVQEVRQTSSLSRIYRSTGSEDRLAERRLQAQTSLGYYRFVVTGGKLILAVSSLFILASVSVRLRAASEREDSSQRLSSSPA